MNLPKYLIKKLRSARWLIKQPPGVEFPYEGYVRFRDSEANRYIAKRMREGNPLLIGKFGTIELQCIENYLSTKEKHSPISILKYINWNRKYLWWWDALHNAHKWAGLFPEEDRVAVAFSEIMLDSARKIDILGSYIKEENLLEEYLADAVRVNIDGYYAPFLYENPWTEELRGKRVLVIHPFVKSIRSQYEKRELLFADPKVLPEFELITIKAVQSVRGENSGFRDWMEALDFMKAEIDKVDFDVALLGCGAYGLPLAAYVKGKGKTAVHLAGWTQVLFGIYGSRWLKDPMVSRYINEHWTRPLPEEAPKEYKTIESAAYW